MTAQVKMRQKLTSSILIASVSALVGAGAALLFGYAVGKGVGSVGGMTRGASAGLVFFVLMLAIFLALTLHEFGHFLAGKAVGFRLYLFVVGPLRVEREENDRLRISLNRDMVTAGALCMSLPSDDRDLLQRFAFTVLGGPVISFVGALLSFGAGHFLHGLPGLLRFALLLFAFVSASIGVVTAIPMPNGAYLTDGARWLRLRRGGPLAERDAALLHLFVLTTAGRPAAEWPVDLLETALAVTDASIFEAAAHYFAYKQAVEKNRIEAAGVFLERALEIMEPFPAPLSASYRMEAAWFTAWHRNDPTAAQRLLDEVKRSPSRKEAQELLRAQAAVALRSGQMEKGKTLLAKALTALPTGPATQTARQELIAMEECEGL